MRTAARRTRSRLPRHASQRQLPRLEPLEARMLMSAALLSTTILPEFIDDISVDATGVYLVSYAHNTNMTISRVLADGSLSRDPADTASHPFGTTVGKRMFLSHNGRKSLSALTNPADGILYFHDGWYDSQHLHQIGMTLPGGTLQFADIPEDTSRYDYFTLRAGTDGKVWFANGLNGGIGYVTSSGEVTRFSTAAYCGLFTVGSDGDIYFAADKNNIGRMSADGQIKGYYHLGNLDSEPMPGGITDDGKMYVLDGSRLNVFDMAQLTLKDRPTWVGPHALSLYPHDLSLAPSHVAVIPPGGVLSLATLSDLNTHSMHDSYHVTVTDETGAAHPFYMHHGSAPGTLTIYLEDPRPDGVHTFTVTAIVMGAQFGDKSPEGHSLSASIEITLTGVDGWVVGGNRPDWQPPASPPVVLPTHPPLVDTGYISPIDAPVITPTTPIDAVAPTEPTVEPAVTPPAPDETPKPSNFTFASTSLFGTDLLNWASAMQSYWLDMINGSGSFVTRDNDSGLQILTIDSTNGTPPVRKAVIRRVTIAKLSA